MGRTIHKIGGIILKDRKFLVGKTKGKFTMPGGKIESGETDVECLRRELMEEYGVVLDTYEYFDTFEDEAASDPGMMIEMKVYIVKVKGDPKAQSEIEESRYIDSGTSGIAIGSIAKDFIMPKLVEKGLIG
jgi:mutator protein MutT